MKPRFQTLVDAIEAAAKESTPQQGYTFLESSEVNHITFNELWERAKNYAGILQCRGVQKGDRILIVLPTSVEFATIYLGVLLCGAAPCVLPAPDNTPLTDAVRRVLNVAAQLSAKLLIATVEMVLPEAEVDVPLPQYTVAELQAGRLHSWQPVALNGDDLALIQASSGTTGIPKCVALSHSNVLANLQQIGQRLEIVADDVEVCWLPLFHDMGLIGCFLLVLYWQLHGVFMTPYRFIRRPLTWLKAISDYGGTISPAPNFAFALVERRVTAQELINLDLSTWRAAPCGAEPVDVKTLQKFTERFEASGFQPTSLSPCYGLAEASLCVAMHQPGEPFRYERIARSALAKAAVALVVEETDSNNAILICDCGPAVEGTYLRIMDDTGRELPEEQIGSVWVSGPSIMQGYYNAPDETNKVWRAGWLNTGDLGYLRNGHLFITGRSKDLIVIRGHNYQPTDFEWAAAEVSGISKGRVVAFGIYSSEQATEQLYLICERPTKIAIQEQELCETIKLHVGRQTGVLPAHVGLVARNTIPKTSSGKLQRARIKSLYCFTKNQ
jgi:fatty-acyl-CoA synthase